MAERMLKFTTLPQKTPTKRAVSARREDFSEIYEEFQAPQAADQASRCSQCGIPFCSVNCPLGNNILGPPPSVRCLVSVSNLPSYLSVRSPP